MDRPLDYTFVIDAFTERRGLPSLLEISCAACQAYLITYQKDGPGPLLRCYFDRIHGPKDLCNLHDTSPEVLRCERCKNEIGKKGIYEKEDRLAFFLLENSFLIKEIYTPPALKF
ncbi:MAG: hypothetical protein JSR76_03920 [Verrucomicrobia bacterium]|nr:hypothetical protein [Verrucomicrobiota bacterium]